VHLRAPNSQGPSRTQVLQRCLLTLRLNSRSFQQFPCCSNPSPKERDGYTRGLLMKPVVAPRGSPNETILASRNSGGNTRTCLERKGSVSRFHSHMWRTKLVGIQANLARLRVRAKETYRDVSHSSRFATFSDTMSHGVKRHTQARMRALLGNNQGSPQVEFPKILEYEMCVDVFF